MAEERTAEQIQQEIEQSRVALADAVDQLTYRADPKRIVEQAKQRLLDKAQTTQGRIVIGAAGALVVVLVLRRIRKGGKSD